VTVTVEDQNGAQVSTVLDEPARQLSFDEAFGAG
jgi:hypothetical protein